MSKYDNALSECEARADGRECDRCRNLKTARQSATAVAFYGSRREQRYWERAIARERALRCAYD